MDWTAFLAGFGGASVIVGVLFAWLGNLWASRILQNEQAANDKQLEILRLSLESVKEHNIKYQSTQFDAYNALWCALVDLKINADSLWEKVSVEHLIELNNSLAKANELVHKSRIFLDDVHYQQLLEILCIFSDYQVGKAKLFSIRSERDMAESSISVQQLKREIDQIEINGFWRNSYKALLEQICDSLKTRIDVQNQK